MKIASWNIRGIGAEAKKVTVKKLIREERIDMLGLVETKHSALSPWIISKFWGHQNVGWTHAPAEEGSGGILHERLVLWNTLRAFTQHLTVPLLIMGDFNEVVKMEERKNATHVTASMKELRALIQDLQLLDLDINQQFTWMRENAASRIDRIMVSHEFVEKFQNLKVFCKDRMLSDHFPLVLTSSMSQWGPSPFRTLDGWLEEPKFLDVFRKEWVQLAQLTFAQKLKAMKKSLKKWNREVFGFIDTKISFFQDELSKLDSKEQQLGLQEIDFFRRKALQSQLWLWLTQKERYWKQMSRCKFLKKDDRNTRYFHLVATMRRKKKMIESIVVNGVEYTDHGKIKKAIMNHFKNHFAKKNISNFNISDLGLSVLTEEQKQNLIEAVSMEEIEEALASCAPTKAPGYDGFNFKCIKHVWPIIAEDFSKCILNFFDTGQLPASVNMTWVTLIPKKKEARDILDFRPISMVGCIYKVIAKILSSRLRMVIADLVGEAQTAFISGRQILDGALIANKLVSWMKKGRKEGYSLS